MINLSNKEKRIILVIILLEIIVQSTIKYCEFIYMSTITQSHSPILLLPLFLTTSHSHLQSLSLPPTHSPSSSLSHSLHLSLTQTISHSPLRSLPHSLTCLFPQRALLQHNIIDNWSIIWKWLLLNIYIIVQCYLPRTCSIQSTIVSCTVVNVYVGNHNLSHSRSFTLCLSLPLSLRCV